MGKKEKKKKGFWYEFGQFIARGNVMDMAVGVVVGSAFTAIVNSLVTDIINPIIGLATGNINFGNLKIVLRPATEGREELAIGYGMFINAIVTFLIISLVVFCMVKLVNKIKARSEKEKLEEMKKAKEEADAAAAAAAAANPPAEDPQIVLLREIKEALLKIQSQQSLSQQK